ncbi:MAG: glycosylase [Candidatus Kerfeldbacteria bacterium CG08_land_8_20_14_0_20_40_16]|uniref:Glycosylase n=1 Tax=Candidatus Kerfeldbacteria bacterium CG08_land_8_20_14_0_20_40_16 TaxID=2014244 RepID=A0A2H0YVQ6_9BACT|nr:MAG: glycosylase [Candidatus Kerfeldbacteria bacterium CG08_land_8_20_14_0_20_40_16]
MFKWKKLGLVFSPQKYSGRNWMKEFAQAPAVLLFDTFVRVYFSCRPAPDSNGKYVSYAGFVDLQRDNLLEVLRISQNPLFKLGELGTFDEHGTYPASFIRNGDDVMAYYAGWSRCESVPFNIGIGAAVSHDNGETFTKLGNGPIIPYTPDEPFLIGGPKIRLYHDRWYLWYLAGKRWLPNNGKPEQVHKIHMASSSDGLNWEKVNKDLIESKLEENECQASPDVFFYKNKYHMFFCYRYSIGYRGKERGYRIGYASSDDMINWVRDDSRVGIDISEEGWDSEMISYPHVFELDNKVYMFYLGNQVGRYGFGLAELESYTE